MENTGVNPFDQFDQTSSGNNPFDQFDAPKKPEDQGFMSKVEHGADVAYDKFDSALGGVPTAVGTGIAQGALGFNRYMGMALAGMGSMGDQLHSWVTGQQHTENQDWVFRNIVDPTQQMSENAQNENQAATWEHPNIGKVAHDTGRMGVDLAVMAASDGGTTVPTLTREGGTVLQQGLDMVGNALTRSTAASALPASKQGVETGEQVYDATGDAAQAIAAGGTSAETTVLANALPVGMDGKLAVRLGAGAASGALGGEAQREIQNSAMPGNMQRDFSWGDMAQNALFGAAMGGVFHSIDQADPNVVAQRYNDMQRSADSGDVDAKQATSLVSELTAVDGLSDHALNAADVGVKAGNVVRQSSHDALMQSADRYRQIYNSALPDMSPDAAAEYAKSAYADEVQTNSAWSSYTQARRDRTGQMVQAKIGAEVKTLLQQAQRSVPPVEMNKLQRWAFEQPRGQLAVREALAETVEGKKVPDYIEAEYGDDFNPDGTMTEQALIKDQRPHYIDVTYPDSPEIAAAMKQAGIVPYRTKDGLTVMGHPSAIDAVVTHIQEITGKLPGGEQHGTETEVHPAGQDEGARPAEGPEGGNEADRGPEAEAGQPAEADRIDEGDAQQVTSERLARAGEVIDRRLAALDESAKGVRSKKELQSLGRERDDLQDLLLGKGRADNNGVLESPSARMTPEELQQAHDRMGEITRAIESHRQAVNHAAEAKDLRDRLSKADDAGLLRIADKITKPRAAPVIDALEKNGAPDLPVDSRGSITVSEKSTPEQATAAMDAAAEDTYLEPTPAQAKAGNYRKGGILFKSPKGDLRVRMETPDGAVRRGPWGSRKIQGAHYGYITGTKAGDGEPIDVLMTHHAHDDSRPVAVIRQHHPDGTDDEIKVVLGAKNRAEALSVYARQYPPGMTEKLIPNGKRDIVMMDRAKFHRYLQTGETDVPPHPVSGMPMAHLRRAVVEKPVEDAKTERDRIRKETQAKDSERKDENATSYIRSDTADRFVKLDDLRLGYSASKQEHALDLMRRAKAGEIPRRHALAVRDNGDGTYTVLKGADTVTLLREMGNVKEAPVNVVDHVDDSFLEPRGLLSKKASEKLTNMFISGARYKPKFDSKMTDLAHKLGGEYMPGPMKKRLRSEQKIRDDYEGHPELLKDIVRGTMVFDNAKQAIDAMDALRGSMKIVLEKDALTGKPTAFGYRDAKMFADIGHGVLAELQINTKDMLEAKNGEGHKIYEELRALKGFHPFKRAELIARSRKLYEEAWDKSLSARARALGEKSDTSRSNSSRDNGYNPRRDASSSDTGTSLVTRETRPDTSTTGMPSPPKSKNRTSAIAEPSGQNVGEPRNESVSLQVPEKKEATNGEQVLPAAGSEPVRDRGGVRGGIGRVSPSYRTSAAPVEGLPRTFRVDGKKVEFGAYGPAVKAAEEYMRSAGLPVRRLSKYGKVDVERATRIAQAFDRMEHAPNDPLVKAAYEAMIHETQAQWEAIKKTGLHVEFIKPGMDDPYASSPRKAIMDVVENNHLWVFPTDSGFGSDASFDANDNPLLALTGETIDGHPVRANDVFRIVHDYFGHIKEGFGFRAEGEENAWRSHAMMYSPLARRAMTTETRGQNSWVNFGPYAEHNRTASGADTHYADQKIGLMPEWVSREGRPEEMSDEDHHLAIEAKAKQIQKRLKGSADIEVHRSVNDMPDDEPAVRWMKSVGAYEDASGVYYNGKVYLFSKNITDPADAETVIMHEMIGHGGFRAVMGDKFEGFLEDIHDAIKDTSLFKVVDLTYRMQMGPGFSKANAADEYLAALSEKAMTPDTRRAWDRIVGKLRSWLRKAGIVHNWTNNDLITMVRQNYAGIRDGRISLRGLEPPTTSFDDDNHVATTTYVNGKGQRGFVDHFDDGTRNLRINGLDAIVRTANAGGKDMLTVDAMTIDSPSDLLGLSRFAGEEFLDGVAIPKDLVTRDAVEESGIPFVERPGHYELRASQGVNSPMFSLRNRARGTDAQEAILKKTIAHSQFNMNPWDRFQQMLREFRDNIQSGDTAMNLKQSYVDALAPIARAERSLNGGSLLDASESAYKLAWMAKNNEQITAGVMKMGVPEYKDGSFTVVKGRKGLMDIFAPLYHNTPDGKALDTLWEAYAYARRANELIKQTNPDGTPREKLLTQPEIDELLSLEKKYPMFKKVLDDYQEFNKQLLDLAVDRGALSREMADAWKANTYVPFYRALEDKKNTNNDWLAKKGISGKRVTSMRLFGSKEMAEPIIENIIKNSGSILDKIYSNEAMRRTVALTNGIGMERLKMPFQPMKLSVGDIEKSLSKAGLFIGSIKNRSAAANAGRYQHFVSKEDAEKLITFFHMIKPSGHDIVSVMENGRPVYYKVTDPALLRAVTAFQDIGTFDRVLGTILGVPKKVLTLGITLDPRFMYRNLLRDTITAWAQTGTNPNMFKDVMKNTKEVFSDGQFINALRVAGYNGNEYFKVNEMREHLNEMHGKSWTLLSTPKQLYHAYHKIGFVSEQLNRMRIAKHTLDNGGSMAEAAWQAQNTLNFQMRGDSRAMQLLIRAVPFLNARIQGLNRLYDGALGRDGIGDQRRAMLSFVYKGVALLTASMVLALHNENDPRYTRIPEAAKDTYYHLFIGDHHFILPKPFEFGAIASTIPERALRVLRGDDTMKTFAQSMGRILTNILEFDPTPQIVKPYIEDWGNKDSFTANPIVSQSEQGVLPQYQYDARTSPSVKAVAQAMPGWAPDMLRSPIRLQHLVRGYTGTLGTYLLMMADGAMRAQGSAPVAPASRYGNRVLGALEGTFGMGNPDTDPRTKYLQQLYDAKDNADQAAQSLSKLIKEGHADEARELIGDNRTALSYRKTITALAKEMKELRQAEIAVYQSTSLTADEKRQRLDNIARTRVKILDKVGPMLDMIDDYH